MKYIRTKYGTIEENNPDITREILAQADTIEELCDEFVCVRKRDNRHYNTEKKQIFDYWYLNKDFVNCAFYGAIWTEWGLKYVAKMNEEGELELL